MIRIATAQYQLDILANWQAYSDKINSLVRQAKQQNAQLLLLPEYAGDEIVFKKYATDIDSFHALQAEIPRYLEFYSDLAQQQNIYIQPGTLIEKISANTFVNRAYFFSPNKKIAYQDKLQLVEYEKKLLKLTSGTTQTIFDTALGKIGIAICYDSEFPEIVRALTHAGAVLILVPSYCNSKASFNRVFLSCRARAIENQCYVGVSYTVGKVDLAGEPEFTVGQAAILSPADIDFPDEGIIAQGHFNQIELVTADLDFTKIEKIRKKGNVRNFADAQIYRSQYPEPIKIDF